MVWALALLTALAVLLNPAKVEEPGNPETGLEDKAKVEQSIWSCCLSVFFFFSYQDFLGCKFSLSAGIHPYSLAQEGREGEGLPVSSRGP